MLDKRPLKHVKIAVIDPQTGAVNGAAGPTLRVHQTGKVGTTRNRTFYVKNDVSHRIDTIGRFVGLVT